MLAETDLRLDLPEEGNKLLGLCQRLRVGEVAGSGTVICLPTSPAPALPLGQSLSERSATLARITSLTCMGGTTGRPQITLPFAHVEGLPVGLSLLGPRGSDEALIALAQKVESKLRP